MTKHKLCTDKEINEGKLDSEVNVGEPTGLTCPRC